MSALVLVLEAADQQLLLARGRHLAMREDVLELLVGKPVIDWPFHAGRVSNPTNARAKADEIRIRSFFTVRTST
jgi:hypothetical protein